MCLEITNYSCERIDLGQNRPRKVEWSPLVSLEGPVGVLRRPDPRLTSDPSSARVDAHPALQRS